MSTLTVDPADRSEILQNEASFAATEHKNPATINIDRAIGIHSEVVSSVEAFTVLQSEWSSLLALAGKKNVFLTFEWMHTWWKHWGAKKKLAIICVRNGAGELIGFAPLYLSRGSAGMRRLGFLADKHSGSDYLNVVAHPQCEDLVLQELASQILHLRRHWDYIDFEDAEDSPLFRNLSQRLETSGLRTRRAPSSSCFHMPLPPTFAEFLDNSIASRLKRDYLRRWRLLRQKGETEFLTFTDSEGLQKHFPELLRLHSLRFTHSKRTSAFLLPGVPEFHADVLKSLAETGKARLSLLRVDGVTIAIVYGFSVGGTLQFFQTGFDPDWLAAGPGKLSVGSFIEAAINSGHTEFDFLRGDEAYKTFWSKQCRTTLRDVFFARTPQGQLANTWMITRAAAGRAVRSAIRMKEEWATRKKSAGIAPGPEESKTEQSTEK